MPAKRFKTSSASQTKNLGIIFGKEILRTNPGKRALVIALTGELGAGKTTFTQGVAKGLGIKRRPTSPTFLLARSYPAHKNRVLYHIDCYRIASAKDLDILGLREWLSMPQNIIVAEWAKKISRFLPRDTIHIEFKNDKNPKERTITIKMITGGQNKQ